MKRVLLFGYQTVMMTDLLAADVEVVCVVEDPDVYQKKEVAGRLAKLGYQGMVRQVAFHEGLDDLEWLDDFRGRIDGVIPTLEYGVLSAAQAAEHLGLRGAGALAARALRDKMVLRELTSRVDGVGSVRFAEVKTPHDVVVFGRRCGYPMVVKPANRQGSLGVSILEGPDDAVAAVQRVSEVSEERETGRAGLPLRIIAEEFLHGDEVSVEALVSEGQVVWCNLTKKDKFDWRPVESGHSVGWPVEGWVRRMQSLVDAVAFGTGLLHAEWISTAGAPAARLVECAGRAPGDKIVELIDLAFNGSLRANLAQILCGLASTMRPEPSSGAAIKFFGAESAGKVDFIPLTRQEASSIGVVEVNMDFEPGAMVPATDSSWARCGHVMCVGEAAEEARERCERASRALAFKTLTP